MGLGGSAIFHTVALAGVSYLSQNSIDDLEITAIERVEVDPEPSPTPSTKSIPSPEPKIVKPIIASVPTPVPVKIPTPKAISTPPPVVKITKSAVATKPPTSPLASVVSPQPNRVPTAAPQVKAAPKPNSPPAFPDRLFTDPTPTDRPQIATQKVKSDPPQSPVIKRSQPTTTADRATLAPTTSKLAKLIPNPSTDDNPSNDEFIPSQPGNTSKLARTTERSPAGNNQTNLATGNKVPQGLGNNFGATESNPSPINEDFGSGTPGNSTRIARSNSGGTGVSGTSANQTGLGGGSRRNRSIGSNLDGNGSGNNNSGSSDELGSGLPGNIATGSKNQLSIQCLRNCEIRYPDSLETSDTGTDKILLKVSIDPNGSITNAEIARSSGNPKLDRATLEGVKQMQLTAMGKPLTFRIRVSTLTSN